MGRRVFPSEQSKPPAAENARRRQLVSGCLDAAPRGPDAACPALPYGIDLLAGPLLTTDESKLVAFRPKKK